MAHFEFSLTIKRFYGKDEVVKIPAEINGLPVTEIGKASFGKCENLQCIYIDTSNWNYADIQRIFGKNPPFAILPLE